MGDSFCYLSFQRFVQQQLGLLDCVRAIPAKRAKLIALGLSCEAYESSLVQYVTLELIIVRIKYFFDIIKYN